MSLTWTQCSLSFLSLFSSLSLKRGIFGCKYPPQCPPYCTGLQGRKSARADQIKMRVSEGRSWATVSEPLFSTMYTNTHTRSSNHRVRTFLPSLQNTNYPSMGNRSQKRAVRQTGANKWPLSSLMVEASKLSHARVQSSRRTSARDHSLATTDRR